MIEKLKDLILTIKVYESIVGTVLMLVIIPVIIWIIRKRVCKYYNCGHCDKRDHLSMSCPYENKEGYPVAWKQRLFCEDYDKKEE